jgi:hypothetical protein
MNEVLPIVVRNKNLEILVKMINSVAVKYECRVEYIDDEGRLEFHGDRDCCRHITAETLALFPSADNAPLPIACPADEQG